MAKIGVLFPNVSSAEQYKKVLETLHKDRMEATSRLNDDTPEEDLDMFAKKCSAYLVYNQFSIYAVQQDRPMYMTWDELRNELSYISNLEDATKYLIQKGHLKEGFIELP